MHPSPACTNRGRRCHLARSQPEMGELRTASRCMFSLSPRSSSIASRAPTPSGAQRAPRAASTKKPWIHPIFSPDGADPGHTGSDQQSRDKTDATRRRSDPRPRGINGSGARRGRAPRCCAQEAISSQVPASGGRPSAGAPSGLLHGNVDQVLRACSTHGPESALLQTSARSSCGLLRISLLRTASASCEASLRQW